MKSEKKCLQKLPVRYPTNGTFELTVRCNLHCKMCMFRHADCENADLIAQELTATQWIDLAKQAAEAGTMHLLITGGEPMLRSDFCEIWEGIYKQGFVMELYTNATMVTPNVMKTLKQYPPHRIGITIYGASPETYKKVCGDASAYDRMIAGMRSLRELPSAIEFRATLIQDSFADGPLIDELVKREAGERVHVKQASPINKAVRGACADVAACRIPPEQDVKMKVDRLTESIREVVGERFDPSCLKIKRKNEAVVSEHQFRQGVSFFGCQAGMSQYTITYEGRLLACQMIDAFSTNVLERGLVQAWEEFPKIVHIPYERGRCGACEYVDTCLACYGTRYAETGDFNGCSEYIYRMAKVRKQYENYLGGLDNEECKV